MAAHGRELLIRNQEVLVQMSGGSTAADPERLELDIRRLAWRCETLFADVRLLFSLPKDTDFTKKSSPATEWRVYMSLLSAAKDAARLPDESNDTAVLDSPEKAMAWVEKSITGRVSRQRRLAHALQTAAMDTPSLGTYHASLGDYVQWLDHYSAHTLPENFRSMRRFARDSGGHADADVDVPALLGFHMMQHDLSGCLIWTTYDDCIWTQSRASRHAAGLVSACRTLVEQDLVDPHVLYRHLTADRAAHARHEWIDALFSTIALLSRRCADPDHRAVLETTAWTTAITCLTDRAEQLHQATLIHHQATLTANAELLSSTAELVAAASSRRERTALDVEITLTDDNVTPTDNATQTDHNATLVTDTATATGVTRTDNVPATTGAAAAMPHSEGVSTSALQETRAAFYLISDGRGHVRLYRPPRSQRRPTGQSGESFSLII